MSAETTYYARIPKLLWVWVEESAIVADDVWQKYPNASDVLHWSAYENLTEEEKA